MNIPHKNSLSKSPWPKIIGIFLCVAVMYFVLLGALGIPTLFTKSETIIEEILPKDLDNVTVWRALEERLKKGSLSEEQVSKVIAEVANQVEGSDSEVRAIMFNSFLDRAKREGLASRQALIKLADAYHNKLSIWQNHKVLAGHDYTDDGYTLYVGKRVDRWVSMIWRADRITLNGREIEFWQDSGFGAVVLKFPPLRMGDDYELKVDFTCAYLKGTSSDHDYENIEGEWPDTLKQWQTTISIELELYQDGQSTIELVTDPQKDPGPKGGLVIKSLIVDAVRDGRKRMVMDAETSPSKCGICWRIYAVVGDNKYDLGHVFRVEGDGANGEFDGTNLSADVDDLAETVEWADILLEPAPELVENFSWFKSIWGKPVLISKVPLARRDL